ncbi:hypothetical protein [Micromonospora sp. KC606]|uniref:hypothetical protein n=1 Tax=Micromonospora sp. KC606 TaxID=2530379 RepID=UPI001FB70A6C|nr:hypothetical protein [Micromonospora sp. KC606]
MIKFESSRDNAKHTPLDTPTRMDRGSLQQHGDNALGPAREFGRTDLTELRAGHDGNVLPGPRRAGPLPGLADLAAGRAGAGRGARARLAGPAAGTGDRRPAGGWRLAAGFGLALVPIVAAPLAAQLLWAGIGAVRPG